MTTLPEILFHILDSTLPVNRVGDWSVEREIVGNVLPGNVRGTSGLTIGSASVSVAQTEERFTPWSPDPIKRLTPGGAARLYLDNGRDLGAWLTAPTSGGLVDNAINIELIEKQYIGRKTINKLPPPHLNQDNPIRPFFLKADSIWAIDALARQVGFFATPQEIESTVLSLPLAGSLLPNAGENDTEIVSEDVEWINSDGTVSASGDWEASVTFRDVELSPGNDSVFFTVNLSGGTLTIWIDQSSVLISTTGWFAVDAAAGGAVQGPWTPGADSEWPTRVQVEFQHTGDQNNPEGTWSGSRARLRSSRSQAWSPWVTSVLSNLPTNLLRLKVENNSVASAFQMTWTEDDRLWASPNAHFQILGTDYGVPWLPGDMDVWTGIQEIAASSIAVAWLDDIGELWVRNRSTMAGVGISYPRPVLDVNTRVEDLGWSIDPADTADRLEVNYQPIDLDRGDDTGELPWLWEADAALEILPGQILQVVADLANPGESVGLWEPAWVPAPNVQSKRSLWSAYTRREGDTSPTQTYRAADDALTVTDRSVSAGRSIITIKNNAPVRLYLINEEGEPYLKLRGTYVARQDNVLTVERGVPSEDALNPVTVDLGRYIQTEADAITIADYIWDRVNTPMWKVSSIRVALDWDLDIGQILELSHPDTDLQALALITKVALAGSPGEIVQNLDLVLLNETFYNFDQVWASGGRENAALNPDLLTGIEDYLPSGGGGSDVPTLDWVAPNDLPAPSPIGGGGAGLLTFTGPSTGSPYPPGLTARSSPLIPGVSYTWSIYVYVPSGSPNPFAVSNSIIGTGTAIKDSWVRLEVTFTAGSVNYAIWMSSRPNVGDKFYFTGSQVIPANAPATFSQTFVQFDAVWAGKTFDDFDFEPLRSAA